MTKLITWFITHSQTLGIAALILIATHTAAYWRGTHDGKAREVHAEASRLEQARKAVLKRETKAAAITEHVAADLTKERERIVYRTKTLIERIPIAPDPSRASLPNWFVSLHDSAVTGLPEAPGSAVSPDLTPSGVTDAEAARVVIGNVGACHEYEARLSAWESFYSQLRVTYNGR